MKDQRSFDVILFTAVICLLVIGLLTVYSASSAWALHLENDAFYFVKRQLLFAGVGVLLMIGVSYIDYWTWQRWSVVILIVCFLLVILVLIPGIGIVRGGARSWIGVGAFSIQPAEFMKLGMIIFLSHYIVVRHQWMTHFRKGMLPALLFMFLAFGLIMLQPDLGTGTVMLGTCFVLLFAAGAKIVHFFYLGLLGIAGFVFLIVSAPYRMARITSFLDPWSDPLNTGFQIIQSLYAVGPGGLFGLGFGDSRQKFYYLPEPQTDFIFSILAEETGFIGGAFVLLLFGIVLWRGVMTALYAPDLFGTFLAVGVTGVIFIQVMINIGVVIGLFPVTGITLPFLSYGGSSLTLMLLAVGIVLNITRHRMRVS